MKKILLLFSALIFVACSTDNEDVQSIIDEIEEEEKSFVNSPPNIRANSYAINEHSASGTSIGTIEVTDDNNDSITFSIDNESGLVINETTGLVTIGNDLVLDYEKSADLIFTITVSDGKDDDEEEFQLEIYDINEYEALSDEQLAVVNHFKHLALFQDASSPTQEIMRKWNAPMKLFLSGTISPEFQTTVESVIAEFNELTSSGNFDITLVDTEGESNAKLFFGTKNEVENVFPEMYELIKDLSVDGYSQASFVGNFYTTGEIWVSSPSEVLFKHELGHAIGIGHSHLCEAPNPSVMCANIAQDSAFLEIEEDVIKYFYHEDMPSGINAEEINNTLANLILLED